MKPEWIAAKQFLERELEKVYLEEHQIESIQNSIAFLEKEYDDSLEQWSVIVEWVKRKLIEWQKLYSTHGHEIKLDFQDTIQKTAFSVNLENNGVFERLIHVHLLPYPIYEVVIFDIDGQCEIFELPVENFNEVYLCIENTFTHPKFEHIMQEIVSRTE